MTPTLTFRTLEQHALWLELDGQLSDGHWENARPYDHFKAWCKAQIKVSPHQHELGRNFHPMRDTYDLTSPALLKAVGARALGIVRIARHHGIAVAHLLEHAPECGDKTVKPNIDWSPSYMDDYVKTLVDVHGLRPSDIDHTLETDTYNWNNMLRDLREMKSIMRTYRA